MSTIESTTKKLHPLVATAAVAVTVAAVLGAIVLITDQVAAHRGEDIAPAAAVNGAGAPAVGAPTPYGSGPQAVNAPSPGAAAAAGAPPAEAPAPACHSCGVVAGVRVLKTSGQGTGVGAVAGGVVGGLVGHQFGAGHGKAAMSILGAIGGALAGHQVEKEVKATTRYEVDVRLDSGGLRTVSVPGDPGPIVGTRVRVENGQLVREAPQS